MRSLMVLVFTAFFISTAPAAAEEHARKKTTVKKQDKKDTGASCKAPAVGACASCAITCRPGETATCGPGTPSGDLCARPPACTCK
ncbi:MAG TPA: hypothetical protein VHP37_08330 [Burkholderiales bacterium]|nr:hypothetical protein [Burkholderiales bacterium]